MESDVRTNSLPDQLFDLLARSILDGRYAPGDRLPSQRALAAEFGVNMASLRAAVDRLARLGLIEVRHGEAMRVADWRKSGGLEVVAHAAASEPTLLASVFEARALLLREAATLAAERATDQQRSDLDRLSVSFADAGSDTDRQAIDLEFMSCLIDASGNLVFTLILNSMRAGYMARSEDFRAMVAGADALAPHYRAVARTVAGGHGAKAGSAMRRLTDVQLAALIGGLA